MNIFDANKGYQSSSYLFVLGHHSFFGQFLGFWAPSTSAPAVRLPTRGTGWRIVADGSKKKIIRRSKIERHPELPTSYTLDSADGWLASADADFLW